MSLTTTYVYGLALISQGDTSASSRVYFITDGMGNVRYLTSSTGTTVASFTDDAYGQQTYGGSMTNYVYQAEQKDQESNLIFLRARYYDPTTDRFTSKDPMPGDPMIAGSQNGYNYTNNNPVNASDSSGQMPTVLVGAIIGAAVGAVTSGVTYAMSSPNIDWKNLSTWKNFGASVAGGALSGGITGGCLGLGITAIGGNAACGALGGVAGDALSQMISTHSVDVKELAVAAVGGAGSELLGGIGAAKINSSQLDLVNKFNNGISWQKHTAMVDNWILGSENAV